eukprot:COSAG02_NODE_103_length_36570_cov_25.164487_3_plen_157_part_00
MAPTRASQPALWVPTLSTAGPQRPRARRIMTETSRSVRGSSCHSRSSLRPPRPGWSASRGCCERRQLMAQLSHAMAHRPPCPGLLKQYRYRKRSSAPSPAATHRTRGAPAIAPTEPAATRAPPIVVDLYYRSAPTIPCTYSIQASLTTCTSAIRRS